MYRNYICYSQYSAFGFLAVLSIIIAKECSIGFYGLYPICKECPFPSFGFECQYICDCNNDTCDYVTGCMDSMLFIDGEVNKQTSNDSTASKVIQLDTSSKCETGYYGYLLQCKMCPYPSYGTECQSMCDCQNESCNHITGCQEQISNDAEITVTATSVECLLSSVASSSEDAISTNNRKTSSDLTKSVIVVGCIGALIICLHLILCLRESTCRSSDQLIP